MKTGGAVQRFWRSHPIHLAAVSSSVADECPVGWLFVSSLAVGDQVGAAVAVPTASAHCYNVVASALPGKDGIAGAAPSSAPLISPVIAIGCRGFSELCDKRGGNRWIRLFRELELYRFDTPGFFVEGDAAVDGYSHGEPEWVGCFALDRFVGGFAVCEAHLACGFFPHAGVIAGDCGPTATVWRRCNGTGRNASRQQSGEGQRGRRAGRLVMACLRLSRLRR